MGPALAGACGGSPHRSRDFKQCQAFDNIVVLPQLAGSGANFGTLARGEKGQQPLLALVAALARMPTGARALLLRDVDQGVTGRHGQGHAADRVLLPPEFADCADPWDPTHCAEPVAGRCEPPQPPTVPPSFASIFWDSAVAERRSQSILWFGAFKAQGGVLDVLVGTVLSVPAIGGDMTNLATDGFVPQHGLA